MQYADDPDQLPALPDPGPRDGRHGVDRDDDYDPFPANHSQTTAAALVVSLDEAKRHISVLLSRAESGQEVVVTRQGDVVARILPPLHRASGARAAESAPLDEFAWRNTLLQPGASSAGSTLVSSSLSSTPTIASDTRVEGLTPVQGATIDDAMVDDEMVVDTMVVEIVVDEMVVDEMVVDATGTMRPLVLDDLDQLPALPDPGPRDGRHGVDRETEVAHPLSRPSRRPSRATRRNTAG